MSQSNRKGYTLLEVLTVITIIVILSALLFPVLSNAKLSAKRTASISNLRQCGLALMIYADTNGDMPVGTAADAALKGAPTCDPNDTWRRNCDEVFGKPLIGSYGYVRHVSNWTADADWNAYKERNPNGALLVSIYYGRERVEPFKGEQPPDLFECIRVKTCVMPNPTIKLRMDGSAKAPRVETMFEHSGGNRMVVFTWAGVFD
jgi:prepilin-type N-terminal cleavage/methylation domain-containing protein